MYTFKSVFLLIFVLFAAGCDNSENQMQAIDDGLFVYSDIANFGAAVQAINDGEDASEALENYYFSKASPGLKEYAGIYGLTAEKLAVKMAEFPLFYGTLGDLEARLKVREESIRTAFGEYLKLVPDAEIPPTFYFIGALQAGGSGGDVGMLISAEIFAADPGVDLSELGPNRRMYASSRIIHIVTHELAHYTQEEIQGTEAYLSIYGENESLLALSIREGGAEFMAYITSGDHINPAAEAYGKDHEQELWQEYQLEMNNLETGDWMFYKPKTHPKWPIDLGYWMGFKISQSYYDNARDKAQAIQDILGVTDYPEFLAASGYDGGNS